MGLGDFIGGVGEAVSNVGKAAAWTANPTHWDDIARGVGNAAEFVAENPGQVWDTGFEVGRSMLKDQLDPVNLAINAGLIGLTVATGGAAAPAFIAKLGMGAKSLEAGVSGLKAVDTVADTARAVKSGVNAVDTAMDLTRGQKFIQGAQQVATGVRESKGLAKVDNILNAPREVMGAGREAIGLSRYGGMAERRAGAAQKILGEGGSEGAGFFRSQAARRVGGTTNPLNPVQGSNYANMATRFNKVESAVTAPGRAQEGAETAVKGVEIAADPQKAAMNYASDRINSQMLQPSQMPLPTTAGTNQEADTVQGMDWSQVNSGGSAFGRSAKYGPSKGYNNGRGFNTPASVDWGTVVPSGAEVYA